MFLLTFLKNPYISGVLEVIKNKIIEIEHVANFINILYSVTINPLGQLKWFTVYFMEQIVC